MALYQKVEIQPAIILSLLNIQISELNMLRNADIFVEENDFVFLRNLVVSTFNLTIKLKLHGLRQVTNRQILTYMEPIEDSSEHSLIVSYLSVNRFNN